MIARFDDFLNFTDTIGMDNNDIMVIHGDGVAGEAKMDIQKRELVDLIELAHEGKRHRERQ